MQNVRDLFVFIISASFKIVIDSMFSSVNEYSHAQQMVLFS
jgi:hypothetical protein